VPLDGPTRRTRTATHASISSGVSATPATPMSPQYARRTALACTSGPSPDATAHASLRSLVCTAVPVHWPPPPPRSHATIAAWPSQPQTSPAMSMSSPCWPAMAATSPGSACAPSSMWLTPPAMAGTMAITSTSICSAAAAAAAALSLSPSPCLPAWATAARAMSAAASSTLASNARTIPSATSTPTSNRAAETRPTGSKSGNHWLAMAAIHATSPARGTGVQA
jgi:hypothetical protein